MDNLETLLTKLFINSDIWQLVTAIVISGIVLAIGAWMKSYITDITALYKIRSSFNISQNEIFRFDTSTGYKYFRLVSIDRKRVTFTGSKTDYYIPTILFLAMPWEKVKKDLTNYEDVEFFNNSL